jgi:Tuberculosis necrotizing toxin
LLCALAGHPSVSIQEECVRASKISILMAAAAAAAIAGAWAGPASAVAATASVAQPAARPATVAGLAAFPRTGLAPAGMAGAAGGAAGGGASASGARAAKAATRDGHPAGTAKAARAIGFPDPDDCSAAFYWGDKRLGPALLPVDGAVGRQLAGYLRTGGLPRATFLSTYYDSTTGSWIYPPDNGYITGPGGSPEETQGSLYAGQDIDRYGSVYGSFLAPAGLPYSARSIPPQNLDGTPAARCNYHEYQVLKSFSVDEGPIAPWFGQPGGGEQFQLDGSLVGGAPPALNVQWLLSNGYLQEITPS